MDGKEVDRKDKGSGSEGVRHEHLQAKQRMYAGATPFDDVCGVCDGCSGGGVGAWGARGFCNRKRESRNRKRCRTCNHPSACAVWASAAQTRAKGTQTNY